MTKDIPDFLPLFIEALKKDKNSIAYLSLSGKLEDYLVKRFLVHIQSETKGHISAYTNFGSQKRKEGLRDICLFDCDGKKDIIYSLVEAKYIESSVRDNYCGGQITKPLEELDRQCPHFLKVKEFGGCKINIKSESKSIYGLVFCCFKGYPKNDKKEYTDKKNKFFEDITKNKFAKKFKSINKSKAELEIVFDDCNPKFGINDSCYVTLRVGLWIKRNKQNNAL